MIVHFHDIVFPYDYTPDLLDGALFFSHESVLLHAFLTFNTDFRILASLSMLQHRRTEQLKPLFSNYRPAQFEDGIMIKSGHAPSSIFLKRVGETN